MNKIILLAPLALSIAFAPGFASAKEVRLKASAEKVRSACSAAGGQFSGVTGTGTYGCDNTANGTDMVLCTKNGDCTHYTGLRVGVAGAVKRAAPVIGRLAAR